MGVRRRNSNKTKQRRVRGEGYTVGGLKISSWAGLIKGQRKKNSKKRKRLDSKKLNCYEKGNHGEMHEGSPD